MRAVAEPFVFSLPDAGSPDALNVSLLGACVAACKDQVTKASAPEAVLKLFRDADVLSSLSPQVQRRFISWVKSLTSNEFLNLARRVTPYMDSVPDFFNTLGGCLFTEDLAKSKGAVFTPAWLAKRVVAAATKHWRRLNAGATPSLAADLSCGPGVFLLHLASELAQTKIIGVDNCQEYVSLARLLTCEADNVDVHCADTLLTLRAFGQLTLNALSSPVPSNGYDIIVGNPPYVRCQSLNSDYSKALRGLYPDFAAGNFDLAALFLAHTLEALAPGGIAALVISSKFMTSRYGAELCRRIGQQARLLEIVDFGDGQVFNGRTTYTCILTFAKLPPNGSCRVLKFPPGLKWTNEDSHMSKAEIAEIPSGRFRTTPWDLSSGAYDDALRMMRDTDCPRLLDVFPNINQGIRTGANQFFVVPNAIAVDLEKELVLPFISGENVRRCQILPSDYSLIWPYRFTDAGAVAAIREDELTHEFPLVASYLGKLREQLSARDLEPGIPWYAFSRSQNLDLAHRPKIIGRELMPRAEFAADDKGKYAICSGYALLPPSRMSKAELQLWAAVLSTPTMEFQLRHTCTQLHSGWFRILKQHLNVVHLPPLSESDYSSAMSLSDQLHVSPSNGPLWEGLDAIVSRAFRLSAIQRSKIHSYIEQHHSVSSPNSLFDTNGLSDASESASAGNVSTSTLTLALSREQREMYLPVELPEYYELHTERDNLRQAVTFVDNKSKPIHRWYSFTQGFSVELVKELLSDLAVSNRHRVYDPFAGSGTTLLACKQAGIPSFGSEISPLLCWITRLKTSVWDSSELRIAVKSLRRATPSQEHSNPSVFQGFFEQAYAPKILNQIFGWRDWIVERFASPTRDFLLLGLASLLEVVSQLRKHGSHYRFLNKTDSLGLAKLNIPVISSDAELRPLLAERLDMMIDDVESARFPDPTVSAEVFDLDSRQASPVGRVADVVITSPPYLNRNMYFAQQKAELVLLNYIHTYEDYRSLVRQTFRSHVEGQLAPTPKSDIPEIQTIVDLIKLSENNNAKIPHMVCGYFDDLRNTLATLRQALSPGANLAFVVGNCRWGGVVIPVDHLLCMIAERLGYSLERIIVTRLKGNSPQQMRRYGKIPLRESVVLLKWPRKTS